MLEALWIKQKGPSCTFWLLETYTDADWSANKKHRKSTSCAVHMVNGNFAKSSSRTQRVVSLSSAESELHSMVSGCSDAIFIKRCLEFLSCSMVTHQQWNDNSAARMLVSRQGVARIRHPSGKILWIQALVLQQEVSVGQIPTAWNYSDVRTKPLAKNRRLALLNQLGASDAETLQSLGQEEYEIAAERTQNQQSLKRLSKAIFRMAAAWGLESGFHLGAEAIEVSEVCLTGQAFANGDGNLWLWLAMFFMLARVVRLAVKGYFMLRQTATDLTHCWNQVSDEDAYVATQEWRINMVIQKCESLENRLEQILAELKDAAEFTHQIVMVSLFRNVAFRVTTFFNMILRVSLKWWVGGPLCFNHSKASDGGLTS